MSKKTITIAALALVICVAWSAHSQDMPPESGEYVIIRYNGYEESMQATADLRFEPSSDITGTYIEGGVEYDVDYGTWLQYDNAMLINFGTLVPQ